MLPGVSDAAVGFVELMLEVSAFSLIGRSGVFVFVSGLVFSVSVESTPILAKSSKLR